MNRTDALTRLMAFMIVAALTGMSGCGKTSSSSASEDTSTSGLAAAAVGGALSDSSSSGTQAFYSVPSVPSKTTFLASLDDALNFLPSAEASVSCPTPKSTAGCTSSADTLWLSYNDCSFGRSPVTRNGTLEIISSSSVACGTFPNPGANSGSGTLTRQYVSAVSSTTPGSFTMTNPARTVTIDDSSTTPNLGNFDNDTINPIINGGYGTQVTFTNGARSAITLGHHISSSGHGVFDHSITGTLSISETAGSSSRTVTGTVKVYHNLWKVIGTSTFNSVVHSDTCCFPISGSITTAFSAGASVQPTTAGQAVVGKSETMTFTGCGTASLQGADGTTSDVTLTRCF